MPSSASHWHRKAESTLLSNGRARIQEGRDSSHGRNRLKDLRTAQQSLEINWQRNWRNGRWNRNHQELRSFLGIVGWCRLWILNFGLLAKPLYEALKEPQLEWNQQQENAFRDLKKALKEAPALGLLDLEFLRSEKEEGELAHDCVETIEQVYASRIDLKDVPLEDPDWELFTDGSSYVDNGTRYAGYAVVTSTEVVEAKALTPGTSAQRAEIVALIRALILSTEKKVNIWTDSKYAFGVVHIHGALWKERGLLNSQGTVIKYRDEILALLDAVHKPAKVAVMHVRGHQKEEGKIFQGNRLADAAAKRVAREVWTQMALVPVKVNPAVPHMTEEPKYSADDEKLAAFLGAQKNPKGWYVTATGQVVVPTKGSLAVESSITPGESDAHHPTWRQGVCEELVY